MYALAVVGYIVGLMYIGADFPLYALAVERNRRMDRRSELKSALLPDTQVEKKI